MEKIKVLIADDLVQMTEIIKQQLEKIEGIEIVGIAIDGQDEVEKIEKLKPDLVFTDNQMPKLNGIDVVDFVRNSAIEKKPDFVIITGDNDIDLMKRAYSLDVVRLIRKPCDESKLIDAIEEYKQRRIVIDEKEETCTNIENNDTSFFGKIKKYFKGGN